METTSLSWRASVGVPREEASNREMEIRVLRSRLMNLTLDWELAALTLDAQRYHSHGTMERESLRDSAVTYRKCISELSEILSGSSVLACKTQ
jgi:hypothetical protein